MSFSVLQFLLIVLVGVLGPFTCLFCTNAQLDGRTHENPPLFLNLQHFQVALEGQISRKSVEAQLARGHRSAGDLIPWTIAQQFGDSKFAQLSGARIVRIATHPSLQGMGYGSRAMELLFRFFNGEMISLDNDDDDNDDDDDDDDDEEKQESDDESTVESDVVGQDDDDETGRAKKGIRGEKLAPRKELPPLLLPLTDVDAPRLDWIGTSFGLTHPLLKFWNKAGMRMLYLRQTANELTGEHSAILLKALPRRTGVNDAWLSAFVGDTRRRLVSLLSGPFRTMDIRLAMAALENVKDIESGNSSKDLQRRSGIGSTTIDVKELNYFLTHHDLKRLELYGRNLCDHHLVTDLVPAAARLFFMGRFGNEFKLSSLQAALLCGIGIQHRDVSELTAELGLPSNQVLAMFNKAVRKMSIALNTIVETDEKAAMLGGEARRKAELAADSMRDVAPQTLEEDAAEGATTAMNKLGSKALPREVLDDDDIMQYAVKGSDAQWTKALEGRKVDGDSGHVKIQSVRETKRKLNDEDVAREAGQQDTKKKGKKQRKGSKKRTQ